MINQGSSFKGGALIGIIYYSGRMLSTERETEFLDRHHGTKNGDMG
jgi:hypothetical protein